MESDTCKRASRLLGLPFVPLEDVNETFKYIMEKAEENLDDLINYVGDYVFMEGMEEAEEDQKL